MSSASEHHEQADRLLRQAGTAKDEASRRDILAEAQVHASLAVAAALGAGSGSRAAAQPSSAEDPAASIDAWFRARGGIISITREEEQT